MSKTACVLTYGCTHNQKDSQIIEQQLLDLGYDLTTEEVADFVFINTCTVKNPTENKIYRKIKSLEDKKRLVVGGCLAQSKPEQLKKDFPNVQVVGLNAVTQVKSVVEEKELEKDIGDKVVFKSNFWNPYLNIIGINDGCLNNCTFCDTKNARGDLKSYSVSSIVGSVRAHVTPEVWLTSEDTGCYGFDIKTNLPTLLSELTKIDRKMWVRVGMGNPNHVKKILNPLIEEYKSDNVYKFLHLPLQSGSDAVLRHMRRGYLASDYLNIVKSFRKAFPQITIGTDLITGYPTETVEDFEQTIKYVKLSRPSVNNISMYSERKGTKAALLKQLPNGVRKDRSRILTGVVKEIQLKENKKWVGQSGEVLVSYKGKKGGMIAHNYAYKTVIIKKLDERFLGKFVTAKIVDTTNDYLIGEVLG